MNTIGDSQIWSFYDARKKAVRINKTITQVRKGPGHEVTSYLDLATKVAELQFRNPDFVLLFRGQNGDHRNFQKNTTLKPSLFRSTPGSTVPPDKGVIFSRFRTLGNAERHLVSEYTNAKMPRVDRLKRYRLVRWAILQHYEVCPTPLLDITHSLRIAASFASDQKATDPFIFVLGVPNLSGAITASAEAGVQIVRLASVCPPTALRPHIQEGYLVGEYPEMASYNQKSFYGHHEIDFGRRLIAKFRFEPATFWKGDTFPQVSHDAIYPPADRDPLYKLARRVKGLIRR